MEYGTSFPCLILAIEIANTSVVFGTNLMDTYELHRIEERHKDEGTERNSNTVNQGSHVNGNAVRVDFGWISNDRNGGDSCSHDGCGGGQNAVAPSASQ
jgi:hypothetical protein